MFCLIQLIYVLFVWNDNYVKCMYYRSYRSQYETETSVKSQIKHWRDGGCTTTYNRVSWVCSVPVAICRWIGTAAVTTAVTWSSSCAWCLLHFIVTNAIFLPDYYYYYNSLGWTCASLNGHCVCITSLICLFCSLTEDSVCWLTDWLVAWTIHTYSLMKTYSHGRVAIKYIHMMIYVNCFTRWMQCGCLLLSEDNGSDAEWFHDKCFLQFHLRISVHI